MIVSVARPPDPIRRIRKVVALSEPLWLRILDYRFTKRIPSERATVEALILAGLEAVASKAKKGKRDE